jgi:monovalent cation:proton antiporter-2 (CPA2) family protein
MSTETFFTQAFVYLTAAVVAVPIAKRFGLGSVLGYLLAGMVIGPFGLGFVGQEGEDVMHFAEFGVVMMLFVIGLELEPARLWRLRGPILGLGGLQVLITTGLLTGGGIALGLPWQASVAVGMTLALSSTAIVLSTLDEKGLMNTAGGQGAFSVLLFQDIAVIPMLAIMPLLATGHGVDDGHGGASTTWLTGQPGWVQTLIVLGAVAGIILGGRYALRPVFRILGKVQMREIFTAASLLLVIGVALLMGQVGLSPALGTFLAGVVLANSEYRHELEADIDPFKGLLLGLFFIAVGASMDFALIGDQPGTILGLALGIVALKFFVLAGLGRSFGLSTDQNLLFAFALPQMGEFAFVLFSFANVEGVLAPAITSPLVAAVALSMALTPLLLLVNERFIQPRVGTRESEAVPADAIEEHSTVIIAGFDDFGNTVGRLMRARGVGATVLDHDSDRVELLRKLGLKVYYGDPTRVDLLEVAGATEAKILVIALSTRERTMSLLHSAKQHFPNLFIMARATDWSDAHDLMEAGADRVYRQNLDSALRMGADILRDLGFRAYDAERATQTFLKHDEDSLYELLKARQGGDSMFFTEARRRIHDLESMLLAGMEDAEDLERDAAWDAETLIEEFGRNLPE